MQNNVIPDGKSKWGRFYELRDKVDQALRGKILLPSVADPDLN